VLFFEGVIGHYRHELFPDRKVYVGHVAIYLSDDLIIHAKSDLGGVVIQKLSELQKDKHYKTVLVKRYIENMNIGGYRTPLISQFLDIKEKYWQDKSCGVVSLAMAMSFLGKKKINANDLLNRGLEKNFYIKEKSLSHKGLVGWSHKGLVDMARSYGFLSRAYDFAKKTNVQATAKLLEALGDGPVLASSYKDFNTKNSGHLFLMSGIKNGKIEYYDPNSKERKGVKKEVDLRIFLKGWKKRFIVVYSKNNKD